MVHIVPIGIDCGVADILRKHGKRTAAFPFDWNVSYGGVSKIIQDKFSKYIPADKNWCAYYGTSFNHDTFPEATDKYKRRIERLLHLLETTPEQVTFIRKCHARHNHEEPYADYLCDEIQDAIMLDKVLAEHYSQLKYKIVVIVICNKCCSKDKDYSVDSERIKLYNIVCDMLCDEVKLAEIVLQETNM